VEVFSPVLFLLVGLLFPLVFRKSNFVGFLAHLVVPICHLDELSDDAFVCINSLTRWDIFLKGGGGCTFNGDLLHTPEFLHCPA
jgi:hypothetical protein